MDTGSMINNLLIIRAADPNPTPVTFYLPEMVTNVLVSFGQLDSDLDPIFFSGLNSNLKKQQFFFI